MKLIISLLILFMSFSAIAQDTVFVQTLTFNDITQRRGEFVFPDEDQQFRKILMYYTLKCDPQTTQDQFDCGEWDYLTYNFLYDHTGNNDSLLITQSQYFTGITNPEMIAVHNNPLYNYYLSEQLSLIPDSIISEQTYVAGEGTENSPLFADEASSGRSQFIWTASELSATGLTAGTIQRLGMFNSGNEAEMLHLTVRMAQMNEAVPFFTEDSELVTVYTQHTTLSAGELNFFNLTTPFEWDGTSDIIIDFAYEGGDNPTFLSDAVSDGSALTSSENDGYIEFEEGDYLKIPVSGEDFGNEITVSLWAYGNPDMLPANTYLFEAFDEYNDRSVNVHLPWSNGRVYWDAGSGSGYDRIDKTAGQDIYSGSWNHWTFTKNSATGVMNIYLNGELWHTGEGKDRPVGRLYQFNLGKGVNSNAGFPGKVDEFRVWKKELDETTIQEWMSKSVDPSHPFYEDLVIYYDFDSGYDIQDETANLLHPAIFGSPLAGELAASDLFKNSASASFRPQITFTTGNYQWQEIYQTVVDSVLQPPLFVTEFVVTDSVLQDIVHTAHWPEGCSYWWSAEGILTDSLCYTADQFYANSEVDFFGAPFEVIDRWEIGRFITPYGIGLDLGPEGFTWIYDVTDYGHLLRDTVDLEMGNQQELIDVKFAMITGTPVRDVVKLEKVWGDLNTYTYSALDNDAVLSEKSVSVLPETEAIILKTRLTGHGHNSNTGDYPHCCEWKDNTHYLFVNGSEFEDWKIWQTTACALNPVFPQGGTWPGAREGWCPGDLVKEHEINLSSFAGEDSFTLDYDITPVPANNQGMGGGNYRVAMHLFQYGTAAFNLDAEVYDVLNPSLEDYYSRHNPICFEPRVVIRNAGNTVLESATISYGVSGGETAVYEWTGNLAPMEREMVTLDVSDMEFWNGDLPVFEVEISNPNGETDENPENDSFSSVFNQPDVYPNDFIIWFKTNNYPWQNEYTVRDIQGNVVFQRNDLEVNTVYRDTMDLAPGCYTFEFNDSGNDGLQYWANPPQGNGYLRFKLNGGPVLKNFAADFGASQFDAFSVGEVTSINEWPAMAPEVNVFPNPSSGQTTLELSGYSGNVWVEITDALGAEVSNTQISMSNYHLLPVNLGNRADGIYFIRIYDDAFQVTKKILIQK
jgi:hypothetical protein